MGKYKEPVKYTCPDIDQTLEWVDSIRKCCEYNGNTEVYTHEERYNDILYYTLGISERLEELRDSNRELREWGNDLNEEIENADDKIHSLEIQLEEINDQLSK